MTLFFCEKYPNYICEGLQFKDGRFSTDNPAEIEKIRKSPIYRGYIKETEAEVPPSPPPLTENKISPEEMKSLQSEAGERRKERRGGARQGVVTTEHLKRQK